MSTLPAKTLFEALSSEFASIAFLPGTPEYDVSSQAYWSLQARAFKPACILRPKATQNISHALKRVYDFNMANPGEEVHFAIRGGGHAPWPEAANVHDGILLDLSLLNGITIDREKQIVSIGAGQKWFHVYEALEREGLMCAGGRGNDIGVAGLTLGGGVSHYVGHKGFACDNVANFEVILGNGSIVNANAQEHPTLFKALKGGSNNFGVVTRFDLYTFSAGDVYGGLIVYGEDAWPSLVHHFLSTFAADERPDPNAAVFLSFVWRPDTGFGCGTMLHYVDAKVAPGILKPIVELQPQFLNQVCTKSMSQQSIDFVSMMPAGKRYHFATSTFKASKQLMIDISKQYKATVAETLGDVAGFSTFIMFNAIHSRSMERLSNSRGGNVLGIEAEDGPLVYILLTASWANAVDDECVNVYFRGLQVWIEEEAKQRQLFHSYVYLPYAGAWQRPIRGYGEKNVRFMREVSKRYDPDGVFQKWVPGGFKLGDV